MGQIINIRKTQPRVRGKNVNVNRNQIAILLVRLFAGVTMFFAGFEKAIYAYWGGHSAGWSAASSLKFGGGGLLHNWYVSISTTNWVSPLVYTGEMLIGVGILLGLTLRLACYFGIIENGLFWANAYMPLSTVTNKVVDGQIVATRSINTGVFGLGWSSGPLELNAAVIMMYIILILVGAGLTYGIDARIHKLEAVKKSRALRAIFG